MNTPIIASTIMYLVTLFTSLKLYMRVNLGKSKEENKTINEYIYILIGLATLTNIILVLSFK